jgi:hypothetical protein
MTNYTDVTIIHKIDLFEFITVLLTDKTTYSKFTDKLKASHFFMTQRMLAKGLPIQINSANINGINPVAILDMYHAKLCKDGGRKPKWLSAASKKDGDIISKEQELHKQIVANTEVLELMLLNFNIELKSLIRVIEFDYSYVLSEYQQLLNAIKGKVKK